MWLAKDSDGTIMAYENVPIQDLNGTWCVFSGFYFEMPKNVVFDTLGRNLKDDETIEIEFRELKKV